MNNGQMLTRPKDYQRKGAALVEMFNGRALIADEMGLGKTLEAYLWYRRNTDRASPMVSVVPAGARINWQREARKHFGLKSVVLEHNCRDKFIDLYRQGDIFILSYDTLHSWLEALWNLKPNLVVFDEVHYIKDPRSRRTKAAKQLAKGVPYILGLTGTPILNRPWELFVILNILRPDLFPNFKKYAWEFCRPRMTPWGWRYDGAANLDRLHYILKNWVMIRRLKKDVLSELPDLQRIVVPVKLPMQEYDYAAQTFLRWIEEKEGYDRARSAAGAEGLTKMQHLKHLVGRLKVPFWNRWIEDFMEESDDKLITFGVHRDVLGQVYDRFTGMAVRIDGSVIGRERMYRLDRFQGDARTRLMVANNQAGGIGLNMTAAHTVLFGEVGWKPETQAEARAHRIGQTKDVMIYYMVGEGTIEEDLYQMHERKQRIADAAIDGSAMVSELDIYHQLVRKLRHKYGR